MVEKYINPHTDFGFKRLFGSEFNKELLISFLNAMFHGEQNVQDVTYLNSEQLGDRADARRAIFDVYCENDKGEKFIVEMQNVYQEFFKDRTIYYSTFPIREQAQRGGDWDFHLNPVYTIGLPNFNFAEVRQEGTQTIRGQRQRLSRYSQRHKNSGKEEICRRNGKGQSGRNSGRNS